MEALGEGDGEMGGDGEIGILRKKRHPPDPLLSLDLPPYTLLSATDIH
jgi:hypothetical protein